MHQDSFAPAAICTDLDPIVYDLSWSGKSPRVRPVVCAIDRSQHVLCCAHGVPDCHLFVFINLFFGGGQLRL